MLKQLKIENFRCFKSFELNHLGQINLLVGENNSGKTSILEAIKYDLKSDSNNELLKTKFVSSSSLTAHELVDLFNQIVLTPEEDLVYQALQTIEPNIERIAPIGNEINNNNTHSGFFVRLSNTQKRIPLGSMGDGIWRMLGLSLTLVSAKDGVLLVDEIDTGLHYTALENMWKLIWKTSKKLNVQVFATTHNNDCWKALEALTNQDDVGEEDISIQRIEKDAPRSVAYNKEEIATAVERGIEVR
jgi:AAA15 family ATPase/GTPase